MTHAMRHLNIIRSSPSLHPFPSIYHSHHLITNSFSIFLNPQTTLALNKRFSKKSSTFQICDTFKQRQWTRLNNGILSARQKASFSVKAEAENVGAKSPEVSVDVDSSASIVDGLIDFLNESWTQFHATAEARRLLLEAGFKQLKEQDEWDVQPGGRYFFTRNMSCLVAFAVGEKYVAGRGFHAIAAHTDSPCPKLKPVSAASKSGFLTVNVQPYGAGLWHTWFDRDLSLAGRVILRTANGDLSHRLVKVKQPVLRIPTLAIHLNRLVNTDGFKPNLQTHFIPVLASQIKEDFCSVTDEENPLPPSPRNSHHSLLLQVCPSVYLSLFLNFPALVNARKSFFQHAKSKQRGTNGRRKVLAEELGCNADEIADFELNVCDTQPSCLGGARNEFIFSGRLDNLASCFCALRALLDTCCSPEDLSNEPCIRMVALFDTEEVGSNSAYGAGAPTMFQAMKRITKCLTHGSTGEGVVERAIQQSFLVSADMAHGVHPNYSDKHEDHHKPKLQKGVVIKHNANQRYATNVVTSFLFKEVANAHNLPCQDFVVRNDMGCGSTIGPILASGIGIRTVDCGIPQLSMHSVREMCGKEDIDITYKHFKAFYKTFSDIDDRLSVDC
ncbi:probable aspartyl aminopeptidase isoform X3 [Cryptomeria japonica]|uniref:probable aspartyl aminopeptidase isoform X3 n=1 Tax=Cryptomeria japonica TaxID=3369 RepID=UPI0025ACB228|nr:probable aspartyl aminopeptidase isoform X3 [Cryptomeria japonica]